LQPHDGNTTYYSVENGSFMVEERVNRKLAAILAADVVGYSRLMGAGEAGTLAALKRHREAVFDPAVAAHNGRVVKLIGDGVIGDIDQLPSVGPGQVLADVISSGAVPVEDWGREFSRCST
jgi:class 3 adenylate cyclase